MSRTIYEILVEGYLRDKDMDLEDLRTEASPGLRRNLEGTKYAIPLECPNCDSTLLYSEKRDKRFCPFCGE